MLAITRDALDISPHRHFVDNDLAERVITHLGHEGDSATQFLQSDTSIRNRAARAEHGSADVQELAGLKHFVKVMRAARFEWRNNIETEVACGDDVIA